MAHDLEAVKAYMRFDDLGLDEEIKAREEAVIRALAAGAVEYLRTGGVLEPEGESELYDLAVKALTLHWYDHRDDVGNETSVPVGIRPVITQLKLRNSAAGTGGAG